MMKPNPTFPKFHKTIRFSLNIHNIDTHVARKSRFGGCGESDMCGVFGPFCDIFMAVLVMFVKVFGHNAAGFQCNLNVIPAKAGTHLAAGASF